jgi:predicted Rossmann fold flavoprotein
MPEPSYDLAIVGAGPAGLIAAVRAAECGARVVLLEKNSAPGRKLLITGKERCNITNSETDIRVFADHFGKSGVFLRPSLHRFGVPEVVTFFNNNGIMTKVERGGRVFPESDRARDVQQMFLRLLTKHGVVLKTDCPVKGISHDNTRVEGLILADDTMIVARHYLISTGGLSYPGTGSTGDGYDFARRIGHTVVTPKPALTPLLLKEPWIRDLEGLSLKNVRISIHQKNKKCDDRFGEALFTRIGMSGPIILDMSGTIGKLLANGDVTLLIDFKPALDHDKLDKRILRDIHEHGRKSMENILTGLLPRKIIPVFLSLLEINSWKLANAITKDERKRLRLLLKEFPLTVTGLHGFSKAIITSGGISLREIDPKTMRSRIMPNLSFAGEILDLDGPTGGFNLQVCWATGSVAGEHAMNTTS